jgi:hypothetical protein
MRTCRTKIASALIGLLLLLVGMSAAQAQDAGADKGPSVKVTRGEGGRTVIKIEGIVVKGTVQKPEAFYILHRSAINYDWDTLKQDFVPKILDSVRKSPF